MSPALSRLTRRAPRPALLLIGALVLVVLITMSTRALTAGQSRYTSPAVPAARTSGPAGRVPSPGAGTSPSPSPVGPVRLDDGDYVGEDYDEVRDALIQRGLRVREVLTGRDGPPGSVTDVSPVGRLRVTSLVTVTVVPGPSSAEKNQ